MYIYHKSQYVKCLNMGERANKISIIGRDNSYSR